MNVRQEEVRNRILASLPADEFAEIAPLLEPVGLEVGDRLYDEDDVIRRVHFIEGGLVRMHQGHDGGVRQLPQRINFSKFAAKKYRSVQTNASARLIVRGTYTVRIQGGEGRGREETTRPPALRTKAPRP